MDKINVGILFGGKSAEHEVSLQSARNVYDAIDKKKYNPILIGIDKNGKWVLSGDSFEINQKSESIVLAPESSGELFYINNSKKLKVDVFFPILHGPFGEDGVVQGLLKAINVPFVGAGVLGSAVGMDKDVMKRLLRDAGIPIGKFIVLRSDQPLLDFKKIKDEIGLPFFVKPANMGSSVGVSKINNKSEYKRGTEKAFNFDNKIILEEYIKGREVECSVLGNESPEASVLGEIVLNHEFYSYDTKYIDEDGAVLQIPARVSDEVTKKIQDFAIKTFQVLSCDGMGRVDFFLKEDNKIIVNEINTIPGFTKKSMYPKLWEASGLSYSELTDKLIQLAVERFNKEQKLKTSHSE